MITGKKALMITMICTLLVAVLIAVAALRSCSVTPAPNGEPATTLTTETTGTTEPDDATVPTGEQETTAPTDADGDDEIISVPDTNNSDVPPVVVIPDPDKEQPGLQFPCQVPGHDLKIEKLAPYEGLFVEDGTNVQVTDVAMILIHNTGKDALEYTEITVNFAQETLVFQITALPAGERMVVQEKTGKSVPAGEPVEATALVVHRAQMAVAPELTVTDNGDNTLTVTNLTDQVIPTARVFYKYYMEKEDLFLGGIAFTLRISNLQANSTMVVQPAHFISGSSRVVMALIYDTQV